MNRWLVLSGVGAALSVLVEMAVHDETHSLYPWHALPGFDLVYGATGCVAIVLLSKAAGKAWLQHGEDYWERRP